MDTETYSRPDTAADGRAADLRLPADRRSASRAGPSPAPEPETESVYGVEDLARAFLGSATRGDLDSLAALLIGDARESLRRLVRLHGRAKLVNALRMRGRLICECRTERTMELPDGTAECRLRLFVLEKGGQIRSCYWLVQAKVDSEGCWKVVCFDRLPASGSRPHLDCSRHSPP